MQFKRNPNTQPAKAKNTPVTGEFYHQSTCLLKTIHCGSVQRQVKEILPASINDTCI